MYQEIMRNGEKTPIIRGNKGRFVSASKGRSEVALKEAREERIAKLHERAAAHTAGHLHKDQEQSVPGRRIVEYDYLAHQLICNDCEADIPLRNVINESKRGAASVWTYQCPQCPATKVVYSSKATLQGQGGRRVYDVNAKAAIGMVHAGLGATHLNALLTTMNVPPIHHSTMKRHERLVAPGIERVSRRSCLLATLEEKELTEARAGTGYLQNVETYDDVELTPETAGSGEREYRLKTKHFTKIMAAIDGAYQKRGNGKCFDSQSGMVTLVGNLARKILNVEIFCVACQGCERAGGDCGKPHCKKNYVGSAKSMEAKGAVKLIVYNDILDEAECRVQLLACDNDASSSAALRNIIGSALARVADITHVKKNISNKLYNLRSQGFSVLKKEIISYVLKCVGKVLKTNLYNEQGIRDGLLNIVDHMFNIHDNCDESWCRYLQSPDTYQSRYLPAEFSNSGTDHPLYSKLHSILKVYADKARELAPGGSSQMNEACNSSMGSKALKIRNYNKSDSLYNRVHASVCQINVGYTYVVHVMHELGLSPGTNTEAYAAVQQARKEKLAERQKNPAVKRMRLEYQEQRRNKKLRLEQKDPTGGYRTGMEYHPDAPEEDEHPDGEQPAPEQPTPRVKQLNHRATTIAKLPRVAAAALSSFTPVCFDLETTGFHPDKCSIIQIVAAAASDSGEPFCVYVKPDTYIPSRISELTHITYNSRKGTMTAQGKVFVPLTLQAALQDFISYLERYTNPVLVAHNLPFDLNFLLAALGKTGLTKKFITVVSGGLDTMPIIRKFYPINKKKILGPSTGQLLNHKLETVAKFLLGGQYNFDAHNATGDVIALREVYKKLGLPNLAPDKFAALTFTIKSFHERRQEIARFKTLLPLAYTTGLQAAALSELAKDGWDYSSLRTVCAENSVDHFMALLESEDLRDLAALIHRHFEGVSPLDITGGVALLDVSVNP